MKPVYLENFTTDLYTTLSNEVKWVDRGVPRHECFMSDTPRTYSYKGFNTQEYHSVPFQKDVLNLLQKLNSPYYDNSYNVCFLNYYPDEKGNLGWHADDSPEMDNNHPIAVISFGSEREIWVKEKAYKGIIPPEDRYLLKSGSLFIMPAGYQERYLHRIPKCDRPCAGRISLTYRRYLGG